MDDFQHSFRLSATSSFLSRTAVLIYSFSKIMKVALVLFGTYVAMNASLGFALPLGVATEVESVAGRSQLFGWGAKEAETSRIFGFRIWPRKRQYVVSDSELTNEVSYMGSFNAGYGGDGV